ncbi:MAG: hypothetical protein V7776_09875 [Halopseudomonas aestusnigri]
MQVVIVTDIFGRTSGPEQMVECLSRQSVETIVIDPYRGIENSFANEDDAYASFITHCGHDHYAELVHQKLAGLEGPLLLVGFSVGASAIWRCLDSSIANKIHHFIGFYPGQIRNHLSLNPVCPTTLIFPKEENHFSVDDVMDTLNAKGAVNCHQVEALHGFMNVCSRNYSKDLAQEFYHHLADVELCLNPGIFQNWLIK